MYAKLSWILLAFHSVLPDNHFQAKHPLSCTETRFRQIIRKLKGEGYCFMTCREFAVKADLLAGEKVAVFSFDDGYKDNFRAAQILIEEGAVGTFFPIACTLEGRLPVSRLIDWAAGHSDFGGWLIRSKSGRVPVGGFRLSPFSASPTLAGQAKDFLTCSVPLPEVEGFVEQLTVMLPEGFDQEEECRRVYLSAFQLEEMKSWGMEIGNHTYYHCRLDGQEPRHVISEVLKAATVLEARGFPSVSLALPYGGTSSASLWAAFHQLIGLGVFNYHELAPSAEVSEKNGCVAIINRSDQRHFELD